MRVNDPRTTSPPLHCDPEMTRSHLRECAPARTPCLFLICKNAVTERKALMPTSYHKSHHVHQSLLLHTRLEGCVHRRASLFPTHPAVSKNKGTGLL